MDPGCEYPAVLKAVAQLQKEAASPELGGSQSLTRIGGEVRLQVTLGILGLRMDLDLVEELAGPELQEEHWTSTYDVPLGEAVCRRRRKQRWLVTDCPRWRRHLSEDSQYLQKAVVVPGHEGS